MKPRLKNVFRRGLVKVAQTTGNAWEGGHEAWTTGSAQPGSKGQAEGGVGPCETEPGRWDCLALGGP